MEVLTWERLAAHLDHGKPFVVPFGGTRQVAIGCEPATNRLFIRIVGTERNAGAFPNPYVELSVSSVTVEGIDCVEVSTSNIELFRDFHRFAGLLTEDLEISGATVSTAFSTAAERWCDLVSRKSVLTTEQQLGLCGELAVLEAIVRHAGPPGIRAWTGRDPLIADPHDFRIDSLDLEVKTTLGASRSHHVHGLRQLESYGDRTLYVVSIRLSTAGANGGLSLPERVDRVRQLLGSQNESSKEFEDRLSSASYKDSDRVFYSTRYIFADTPMVIPVDNKCPRILWHMLRDSMGDDVSARIGHDVQYRVNLQGLGWRINDNQVANQLSALKVE